MSFDLPSLPDDWAYVALDSCCKPGSITYGIVQPGAPVIGGVPIIRVNNFQDTQLNLSEVMRVAPEVEAKYSRTKLNGGEVLLTIVGSVGQVAVAPKKIAGFNVARAVAVIDPLPHVSAEWIALCLRSPLSQHLLGSRANTTVQTTINLKDLRALPIPLPPVDERTNIAGVIGALDDRITLLRETNATLEAIAQALFKSWFVDFDPVRAKMEGRAPEGMDVATAALFPDSFEETELGLVPRGWTCCSLKEVCSIFDSKRVPLSGAERAKRRGPYPYYGAAALMDYVDDYLFDGIYLLTGEDGSVADEKGFPITQYVWGKFWVNNHAHILQGKAGFSTEHLALALRRVNIQPYITGAVQAKLSQSNMWRINVLNPGKDISVTFGALIEPLYETVRANVEQAQTLTTLRDTLLPRLISGQLRLPEVESQLEVALV
ncbi:restriction endonuclease subunit S [Alicycliphilus denitrificans]|uniref:Restriction endonuclease subunit S n=1 Tax=Alicycliphilus denitrificans TaxID=179636 RepID=A0A858ZTZ6_9BURK|nr:restriction endonuclease subunit S [Alicycliphilus denitrificans]QKD44164.1 restriction endonuclease subunit S [Alicycliphilus denitrificans]